jgi:microcystin-dependent protein
MEIDGIMARLTNLLSASEGAAIPGTIISYGASGVPSGYLSCNGTAVSRTTYSALFAAIGTTYGGGDGSSTFNVPDLRGEFLRGWDNSRGVDSGRGIGSSQSHQAPSHGHSTGNFMDFDFGSTGTHNGPHFTSANGRGSRTTGGPDSGTWGTANGSETRPRNIAVHYCIKF